MGFFSDLFKKGEDPEASCFDEVLGEMNWSEDDEAWAGQFNGHEFVLAYEYESKPIGPLVVYARQVMGDPAWLEATLFEAKKKAEDYYGKQYMSEISSLRFGVIHFSCGKHGLRIIADLEGGLADRCWRIEYADMNCEGIGFDR